MQTNNVNYLIIFIFSILLSGCSYLEFILGAVKEGIENKEPYTVAEIRQIYSENYEILNDLILICEQTPQLRRIRLKGETERVDNNVFSELIAQIRKKMISARVIGLKCGRFYDLPGEPLVGVSFSVFSSGLSISGTSQYIHYETEKMRELYPVRKNDDVELEKEGWSIVNN